MFFESGEKLKLWIFLLTDDSEESMCSCYSTLRESGPFEGPYHFTYTVFTQP